MNVSSVTEATLGLHHICDTTIDWSPTEVDEDDNVWLACKGMQTACEAMWSTLNGLLTSDMNEDDDNCSEMEDVHDKVSQIIIFTADCKNNGSGGKKHDITIVSGLSEIYVI